MKSGNKKSIIVVGSEVGGVLDGRRKLLLALKSQFDEIIVVAPGSKSWLNYPDKEIRLMLVPMKRASINILFDFAFFVSLVFYFNKFKPQKVLLFNLKPILFGAFASRLVGIKNVYCVITGVGYVFAEKKRGDLVGSIIEMLIRPFFRLALSSLKKVFFQNRDDLDFFISNRLLIPEQKTCLINGSGVDLVKFEYNNTYPEKMTFLCVSRLLSSKGIWEYVEATRELKAKYPFVEINLAGDIDENPYSLSPREIEQIKSLKWIRFLGPLVNVCPSLKNCSVFVLPSYREGTPRVVLEAMATGRAVITTDVPGCRDTTIDMYNGLLVIPKCSKALFLAMEKFVLNPDWVAKMGKNSREIAEKNYDMNKVNEKILFELDD